MHVFLQWQKRGVMVFAGVIACVLLALPYAAKADLDGCRRCMTACHNLYPSGTVVQCFGACNDASLERPCQGIAQRDAAVGFGSAQSGTGRRSSRVQGTTTNPSGATTQPTAPAGNCVETAVNERRMTAEEASAIVSRSGRPSSEFSCQRTCTEAQQNNCLTGGCPGTETAVQCCPPGGGIAIGDRCGARGATSTEGAAGGETTGGAESGSNAASAGTGSNSSNSSGETEAGGSSGGGSAIGRLELPSCIDSGNCQVSDLLNTGLGAIRFMFGLAGALLLVVFVYAGIEYLLADTFGSVKTAKERLQKAVTGIAIMFFGYTFVKFLVNLFIR